MSRVVLDCRGRLANQILCYANARHVLDNLGMEDRLIVLNYPMPEDCATFPGAVACREKANHLPRVTRDTIAEQEGDCLWSWPDVYSNFPPAEKMKAIIQEIELTDSFAAQIGEVIQHDLFVGVHVRFGDFVAVDPNNPPNPMPPFVRAPNDYFLKAMARCREISPGVQFFLASDGTAKELEFLTQSPDAVVGFPDFPLLDLFALSMCRLIIGSASTFSSVAAQYGDAPCTAPGMTEDEVYSVIAAAFR